MTRGEIWWADLGIPFGSESGYKRPVFIVQDDNFNKTELKTILILPLTTNLSLKDSPGNVLLKKEFSGLSRDSVAVVSQLSSIDKQRLESKISKITSQILIEEIEDGLLLILGINSSLSVFPYTY